MENMSEIKGTGQGAELTIKNIFKDYEKTIRDAVSNGSGVFLVNGDDIKKLENVEFPVMKGLTPKQIGVNNMNIGLSDNNEVKYISDMFNTMGVMHQLEQMRMGKAGDPTFVFAESVLGKSEKGLMEKLLGGSENEKVKEMLKGLKEGDIGLKEGERLFPVVVGFDKENRPVIKTVVNVEDLDFPNGILKNVISEKGRLDLNVRVEKEGNRNEYDIKKIVPYFLERVRESYNLIFDDNQFEGKTNAENHQEDEHKVTRVVLNNKMSQLTGVGSITDECMAQTMANKAALTVTASAIRQLDEIYESEKTIGGYTLKQYEQIARGSMKADLDGINGHDDKDREIALQRVAQLKSRGR